MPHIRSAFLLLVFELQQETPQLTDREFLYATAWDGMDAWKQSE
jgi:hypothetical protein